MSRGLTASVVTEISKSQMTPIMFVKFEFDSGNLNLWTGYGDLFWNGDIWTGAGTLLSISAITETSHLRSTGLTFALSGIDAAILELVEDEDYQDRTARVYLGFLDSSNAVIADPIQIFAGRMDVLEDSEDGQTATINLSVEHILSDLERPALRRYTSEDQQIDFEGDKFFDFVPDIQEREITGKFNG